MRIRAIAAFALAVAAWSPFPASAHADGFTGIVAEQVFAMEGEARERELGRLVDTGVQLVRQPLRWAEIERSRGEYDFAHWDRYMAALAHHRLQVLPILIDPPRFRSSAPRRNARRGLYPPRRARDMGAFAARVAGRYGRRGTFWRDHPNLPKVPITSWQVWNEPNLPVYWRPRPSATGYARLLAAVAAGLRRADTRAEVVTAGVPQSIWRGSIPQRTFIRRLYAAGARRHFDTLGIHPYTDTHDELYAQLHAIRRIVRRARDDAPLWITEIGWATQGPGSRYTPGLDGQAQRLQWLFKLVRDERRSLGIRGVVYYMWQDAEPYPGGKDFWGLHTGLHDLFGAEKPALAVFREHAQSLR
jgi:polysaccharide biosynthesis protein PslG